MPTKQEILTAIQETTVANNGKPLGSTRFERTTGIKPYDWHRYWAKFTDAQREAGVPTNQLQAAFPDEYLLECIISVARTLGRIPTDSELRLQKVNDPSFPNKNTFQRLGTKARIVERLLNYCQDKSGYDDVVMLCQTARPKSKNAEVLSVGSPWAKSIFANLVDTTRLEKA